MFDFQQQFPPRYRDCFAKPELLKIYLNESDFIHAVEKLLYNSQLYYFRNEPDRIGEFLLEYRDAFLRALSRFEQQHVSLESYIGFILKTYRKNFHKIKNNQNIQNAKIYTAYNEFQVDQQSIDLYIESGSYDTTQYIAEPSRYYEKTEDAARDILAIVQTIQQTYKPQKGFEIKNLLRILLIYNEQFISESKLNNLLATAKWKRADYSAILAKRDAILEKIRANQNELLRQLQHCYLNYLSQLRLADENSDEAAQTAHKEKLSRLYGTLNSLRKRYLHLRLVPTLQQVSELAGVNVSELKRYCRYLKRLAKNEER